MIFDELWSVFSSSFSSSSIRSRARQGCLAALPPGPARGAPSSGLARDVNYQVPKPLSHLTDLERTIIPVLPTSSRNSRWSDLHFLSFSSPAENRYSPPPPKSLMCSVHEWPELMASLTESAFLVIKFLIGRADWIK